MKLKNLNCDDTKKNSSCDETLKLNFLPNTKTQFVTKLKSSNVDQTQKLKLWQNSNSNCEQTEKIKLWQNSNSNCDKTWILTKLKLWQLKLWQNSNCEKSPIVIKVKLWQHSNNDQTQIVRTKLKLKMWQLKLSQNSRTRIVTKLKNSNCDQTWNMTNLNLRRKTT